MASLESRVAALEAEIDALKSRDALRHVLSQYAIGVDEKRPDVLRGLFTDDACLKVPAWNVEVNGLEPIIGFFENYWRQFDNPRRYYANEDIQIAGDDAEAFMYWHVTQERGEDSVLGWGTYDWTFRRDGGRWRILGETVHIRAMTTLASGWAGDQEPLTI